MGGELFTLFAKLTLDTSEFDERTDQSKEKASMFGDVLKADLVGRGITAAFNGLKNLGGAVKSFTTNAVNAYGDVEQLRGGIETLFGDSAQQVLADADKAFRTAGMSASQYMDTSIQSAASLINSLGGDQSKAAELMNMSITDMADNVNKMGTSMEAVQNAYRGFSRGNFTMLDNLALGFAGTKEGMQDLLDKAEEISGIKYDISSYADMVEAIHVVQTEMGITGTTSKEAAQTIQGSLGAMKSAWENLTAGLADPDANLGELVGNMVDTSATALENIIPAVERAFDGIGNMVEEMAPVIMGRVPELIMSVGPSVAEAGLSLVTSLWTVVQESAPRMMEAGIGFINNIANGITQAVPTLLSKALPMLLSFSETLRSGAGTLVDAGINLLLNLTQGIMDSVPMLLEQLPDIIINIAGVINDNAPKLLVAGVELIVTIGKGIVQAIPALIENFPKIFQAILAVWSALNWMDLGRKALTAISNGVKSLASNIPNALKSIGQRAKQFFQGIPWAEGGRAVINFIVNAIRGMFTAIPSALTSIGSAAVSAFKSINWWDVGANVIKGIVNGLSSNVSWIVDAAKNAAKKALDAAKNLLGISSPSKVFRDEVGKMIPRGMALGISDAENYVDVSMNRLGNRLLRDFDSLTLPTIAPVETIAVSGAETGENGKIVYITNNITIDGAESPEDYASRLVREMELQVRTA